MCRKPNIITTVKVRILDWAGHVVSTCDDTAVKEYLRERKVEEKRHENQNYGELHYIESDLKSVGVKGGGRKKKTNSEGGTV